MRENEMLRALPMFTIFLEVLDLVRSLLQGARLRSFALLIDQLFHNTTISQSMIENLAHWISSGSLSTSNVNPTSATKPSTASGGGDSDFSYDGIHISEADKQHIQELRKFQRHLVSHGKVQYTSPQAAKPCSRVAGLRGLVRLKKV